MREIPTYVYDPGRKPFAYESTGRITRMEYDATGVGVSTSVVYPESPFGGRGLSIWDRLSSLESRLSAIEDRLARESRRVAELRRSPIEPMGQITNMTYDSAGAGVSSLAYPETKGYTVAIIYDISPTKPTEE